ncbi:CoA-acylating methylmalonate-semialdehyde dehydrogenase [Phytohabitans kaempferiae]|uniref:methylmalonate-semialdehyde dehydrogenase (CoA acylating) n=1 Tax=Phytohabitans kaempferiae TaxID=1620943 RepID=A0ABV6MBM0_9ACTN
MRTLEHVIGGARRASATTLPIYDPATGEATGAVSVATAADVDDAVTAAGKAFEEWGDVSLARRSAVMFAMRDLVERHTDELAGLITDEHGKTLDDARAEVARGREVIDFACGVPSLLKGAYTDQASTNVDAYTFRQPLGVCAGITPFNFPVMVPLWMHPLAIACGNTFVLKPSERDPSASGLIASLYADAGLPDGVFNVVHGDKVAVDALLDHPDVAAVSFVGSTPVARYVHQRASAAGKRVQALGGAKNHAVVLPDADLDDAARQITAAAYGSAGQRCMAISAVVAVGAAADPLVERLAAHARDITVGAGRDGTSQMGPVVTRQARDRILSYVDGGEAGGATLLVDGRDLVERPGFYIGPSLFDNVVPGMPLYDEEIFGPVLVVLRVSTLDEAIDLVNANPYGNGVAVFTDSGVTARRFQRAVRVGMVGVNVPVPVPMAYHSFGGWKASLFGDTHVHGPEGVAFYTRAKAVTVRWPGNSPQAAPDLRFPTAH